MTPPSLSFLMSAAEMPCCCATRHTHRKVTNPRVRRWIFRARDPMAACSGTGYRSRCRCVRLTCSISISWGPPVASSSPWCSIACSSISAAMVATAALTAKAMKRWLLAAVREGQRLVAGVMGTMEEWQKSLDGCTTASIAIGQYTRGAAKGRLYMLSKVQGACCCLQIARQLPGAYTALAKPWCRTTRVTHSILFREPMAGGQHARLAHMCHRSSPPACSIPA
jgi:hypothetical protein